MTEPSREACNGDGKCLYQCECDCYDENTGQPFKECTCGHRQHGNEGCASECCVPIECRNHTECFQKAPQWYLNDHNGLCVKCVNRVNDATPDGVNRINRIEECYCCLERKPRLELACNHNICKECWYRLNAYIITMDLVCLRCKEDEITARKIRTISQLNDS
jgi:hypothetical protein